MYNIFSNRKLFCIWILILLSQQNVEFKESHIFQKKPVWIADKETLSCMLCCDKFTVFVRRHHCRCCGRVLCARCTTQKVVYVYY